MTERKDDTQQSQVPAHSTEEEKAKLKDKNKDGIPRALNKAGAFGVVVHPGFKRQ
ncbi:hypothetical protein ACIOWB_13510 [Pseudomonas capeferrum]|uniref:hypothetical protein n=1 Tax=Pseudomonas capeferrum TaxID=1495066 RepID=UPI0037F4ADF5